MQPFGRDWNRACTMLSVHLFPAPRMKLVSTALFGASLLATTAASAQATFSLGLRGGANRATTTLDEAANSTGGYPLSYSAEKSALYAWQAGLVLEARFGKLAFQPALLFSQKGEKLHAFSSASGFAGYYVRETTSTNRYNWLELPLNVVYTLQGDHGLQIFAGPYVAAAVGGRQRGTELGYSNNWSPRPYDLYSADLNRPIDYSSDGSNKRWDTGFNFGVGYRQGPLQVQLAYGLGLINLHRQMSYSHYDQSGTFNTDPTYNRVAQLTATYFVSR